jgi:ZIP family zinc transporter
MLPAAEHGNVLFAFALTVLAGLSTGIGSLIAFYGNPHKRGFLSLALGFSAGVMIYVSLVEIFFKAKVALVGALGARPGYWLTVGAFFAGVALMALIDKFVPSSENPHEMHEMDEKVDGHHHASLHRTGLFVALAIGIHNFPEGLATFMSALRDPQLGIAITVAIALHNIPEGISVAVPIYYATGDKKKALTFSMLSGFAEPIGALVGYLLLRPFMNDIVFGALFALVAGIMVYISVDELLPSAESYGEHHKCIIGFVAGMALMALSLLLFV